MAADEEGAPGPKIDVEALVITPETTCPYIEKLSLNITFSTDAILEEYRWVVRYTVDTSKKRKIVDLGSTEATTYQVGQNQMEFSCPNIEDAGVPDDIKAQKDGLLSAVLTSPTNDEIFSVNMVVQISAPDGILMRTILNPMD